MNMHVGARGSRAQPTIFVQVSPELIAQLAAVIEAGIDLLDQIGGNPDDEGEPIEVNGDEDDEDANDFPVDGVDSDAEPSLGACEEHPDVADLPSGHHAVASQAKWGGAGACLLALVDLEGAAAEDDEDGADDEPSLGSCNGHVKGHGWVGDNGAPENIDRELGDDTGIADRPGLLEQSARVSLGWEEGRRRALRRARPRPTWGARIDGLAECRVGPRLRVGGEWVA